MYGSDYRTVPTNGTYVVGSYAGSPAPMRQQYYGSSFSRQVSSPMCKGLAPQATAFYTNSGSTVNRTVSGPTTVRVQQSGCTRAEAAGMPVTSERHVSSRTYVTDLPAVHSSTTVCYKTADGRENYYTTPGNGDIQGTGPLTAARSISVLPSAGNMSFATQGTGITYQRSMHQREPMANVGLTTWAQEIECSLQAAGMPAAAPPQ